MQNLQERISSALVYACIVMFVFGPLLWICALSLQKSPPFSVFPWPLDVSSYQQVVRGNERHIGSAIFYSLALSSISTALAIITALSAVYLVVAGESSAKSKRRIIQAAIGLYFLPSFAIYPGIKLASDNIAILRSPEVQLFSVYLVQAFVFAFILFLFLYFLTSRSRFEQMLLDTQSRLMAFAFGVVFPSKIAIAIIAALAFATIWSDFFLPALITTASVGPKPFPVILQMAIEQYRTEYPLFAAGAVLSLLIVLLSTVAIPGLAFSVYSYILWRFRRNLSSTS
jgi:ABC-type glycerol-3-phosphate transport system permease component